jgi:hypothetical protein
MELARNIMNNQKNKKNLASLLILLLLSSACQPTNNEAENTPNVAETAESIASTIVAEQLTQVADDNQKNSTEEVGEERDTEPSPTFFVPTLATVMPGSTPSPTSKICLAASLVSETFEDGTVLAPGQHFTKTWWLRNTGHCAWTEEYAFVWHHGQKMTTEEYRSFPGYVAPGESIPFTVDLVAPNSPGTHTSFWTLQDPNGSQFGPSINNYFWAQVTIPKPTGLPVSRTLAAYGWSVRTDGKTETNFWTGDNSQNLYNIGYGAINTERIPSTAILTNIILELGGTFTGNPFFNLGCLNISNAGTGAIMWVICDFSEFSAGQLIYGGPEAIAAGQDSILARELLLELSFDNLTNNDSAPDLLKIFNLRVTFVYNVP